LEIPSNQPPHHRVKLTPVLRSKLTPFLQGFQCCFQCYDVRFAMLNIAL
jgi:hypothetical protein